MLQEQRQQARKNVCLLSGEKILLFFDTCDNQQRQYSSPGTGELLIYKQIANQ
jgi:hypothetical protein